MSISQRYLGVLKIRKILDTGRARLHFAGVLGVSMSALARALAAQGFYVSGSDDAIGQSAGRLVPEGVNIRGSVDECIPAADALIYSLAIPEDSPERRLAQLHGVPQFSRAELLGAMMLPYKNRIGVSGTHGKSTTTAMLSSIMSFAGLSPTVFCGAKLPGGDTYLLGADDCFVYEACEYRDAFLHFSPTCAIITNIELDHTDYFKDVDTLTDSFLQSVSGSQKVILPGDSHAVMRVADAVGNRAITFGCDDTAQYIYRTTSLEGAGSRFTLSRGGAQLGELRLNIPAQYNARNAVAAAVAALEHGVQFETVKAALAGFRGIERRLERLGDVGNNAIYYDYAHHPTAIRESLLALKTLHGSVSVIFRPHTYSRTASLWGDFVEALSLADRVGICDVFAAREKEIDGVSARRLARDIRGASVLKQSDAAGFVSDSPAGAVVLMGAGDLSEAKREVEKLIKGEFKQ